MPCAPKPAIVRFMPKWKLDPETGCWNWTGANNGKYPVFRDASSKGYAHRFACGYFNGPIPDGFEVDHRCRNTMCVNPDHLEAVPQLINNLRSESRSAKQARQTHCKNGHGLPPYLPGQERRCKPCCAQWRRERRLRCAS